MVLRPWVALAALFAPAALACGGSAPPPREPADPATVVRPDALPGVLLPAWRRCQEIAPAPESPSYGSCSSVVYDLRRARTRRVAELYGYDFVAPLTLSCKAAADGVKRLAVVVGPIRDRDGTTLPTWAELADPRYSTELVHPSSPMADHGVDPAVALTHALTLLRCRDAEGLGRFFDAYDAELRVGPKTSTAEERFAQSLAARAPRDAFALADGGRAPPALARAVAKSPRPTPCPTSAKEVVALMHDPTPAERVRGCGCVGELPNGPERREAAAARSEVMRSDPLREVSGGGGAEPAPDVPGAFAPILLAPLVLRSLASGHTSERYPVRDACFRDLPPDDAPTAPPR